jgi:5-methyltetrahydrofolate--homocysteine methyltransferase
MGADLLDLCFAMTERSDEKEQLSTFTNLVAYAVPTPLSFDSTEPDVLEAAIKRYAGRALINSINLENDKYKKVLPLIKQYGLTTIALSIDEKGMARTTVEKLAITDRIVSISKEYGLNEDQLMIDPLTFTLATGEEEYRDSALQTLEAIRHIKKKYPSIHITLGVSNISFGLKPAARKILNRIYLEHAVNAGLDYAIFHAAEYRPIQEFPANLVELANDLILNKRDTALIEFITAFEELAPTSETKPVINETLQSLPERVQSHILGRRREGLIPLLETLKESMLPAEIINAVLLPAMKEVGNQMERGDLILPFVLESAEVMKTAIRYLEGFMDKTQSHTKGTVVLATVFGDVHDIGKNLVKTIIANNGFRVIDLGKQVPVEEIVSKAIAEKADAIALSALLVTTSKQMAAVVEALEAQGLKIPVLVGGAAINEAFAAHIANPKGKKYLGGVYYAKDAFSGLRILEGIMK